MGMQCDVCGTEVRPEHKFCMECGARLAHQTPSVTSTTPAAGPGHPMFDPTTGQLLAISASSPRDDERDTAGRHAVETVDGPADDPDEDEPGDASDLEPGRPLGDGLDADATNVLPALGSPETTFAPPDPTPGAGLPWSAVVDTSPGRSAPPPPPPQAGDEAMEAPEEYPPWPGTAGGYAGDPDLTGAYDRQADQPTRVQYLPDPYAGPPSYVPTAAPPRPPETYDPGYAPTGHLPATYQPIPYEPSGYEQWGDEVDDAGPRPSFRVKPLLILTILAVAAAAVAMFVPVISVTAPGGAAAVTGEWKINDFATNFTVTGIVVSFAMLVGALFWCGGFRWGAGAAGGAGTALAGWAALPLGLAEVQLATSESALGASAQLTRDLGYWCLVGAAGVGVLVTLISLLRSGNDRRAGLDPWVAALGAIATVVATIGPLIPLNGADLDANWTSDAWAGGPGIDIPVLFFVARFANLGLMLASGVFGFLLVRRYGLGLAIAGAVGNGWLLLTAATGQTDSPLGPAYFNPGAEPNADGLLEPYVVTIAGISLIFFFGLVAAAMAIIDSD